MHVKALKCPEMDRTMFLFKKRVVYAFNNEPVRAPFPPNIIMAVKIFTKLHDCNCLVNKLSIYFIHDHIISFFVCFCSAIKCSSKQSYSTKSTTAHKIHQNPRCVDVILYVAGLQVLWSKYWQPDAGDLSIFKQIYCVLAKEFSFRCITTGTISESLLEPFHISGVRPSHRTSANRI